jgi:hypothetical protein
MQGLAAAATTASTGQAVLAGAPTAAYAVTLLDGTKRLFAATNTNIYEASGTTWTDRSRAGNYTGAQRQRFCVFGNVVLAANRTQAIGSAAAGAGFVDIAGAPKASIIESVNGFVMALDTNDATYGDRPDGWWCSGIRDQTLWAPSAATQAANGRLYDTPGKATAGKALGNEFIAYKGSSMYRGRYMGPPLIWAWECVSTDIGTSGAESVVVVDTKHYFVGPNDFFTYDGGAAPVPMNAPCREWFFKDLHQSYRANIIGAVDLPRSIIYWYYPSTTTVAGELTSVLFYNFKTHQWGKQLLSVTMPVLYTSGAITWDSLGTLYATYDDLPAIPYDSPFWLADQTVPGVFVGTQLYSLTGTPGASYVTTGDFGDIESYTFFSRAIPRYRNTPSTGTATNYYRNTLGDLQTTDSTVTMYRSRYDFRRSAKWHSLRMDHTGPVGLDGVEIDLMIDSPE